MTLNLATILRESALAHPDKPVLVGAHTMTYGQLDEASGLLAAGLLAAGLSRGDAVAVQLPNVPEFLPAYFGILKAGLVLVPLNPLLRTAEIAHQMGDSGAAGLVTLAACLPEALPAAGAARVWVVGSAGPVAEGVRSFAELYGAGSADIAPTNADDTAVLLYTSGTTGKPKGAELTHFQLYMNCTMAGDLFGLEEDDVSVAVLPFFHVYGLSSVVNVAVRYGGTLVVVPRFDPEAVLAAMAEHGATVFAGVPTMYHALLRAAPDDLELPRFRVCSSGGSSMPGALLEAFEKRFGVTILEGYGMSETASTATMNRPDDRKPLSVGKPIWGVDARVVDGEGNDLPSGPENVGELLLRGHNVMKGYFRNADATAEALRGGWLHTGDLVYRDIDGFIFIVDRIKDLVIRGGFNVYPREVEEVLYAHPDVAEAAVIGRPDERLGEEVVAVVALRPGSTVDAEGLVAHCRERLAAYKYPREVRILPELPKSATGKLLKRELRDA